GPNNLIGGTCQYDLNTGNFIRLNTLGTVQLTPNYKNILSGTVFFTENDSMVLTLSTIYEPNKPGQECNFVMHTDTVINIPNFISPSCFANFRLGKIEGSVCDTIVSGVSEKLKVKSLKVYPNPSS